MGQAPHSHYLIYLTLQDLAVALLLPHFTREKVRLSKVSNFSEIGRAHV